MNFLNFEEYKLEMSKITKSSKKKTLVNLLESSGNENGKTNITKISELNISTEPDTVSFLDESKKEKTCIVTMLSITDGQFLPEKTHVHCWWCRHSFDWKPLSCAIRYVPNQVEKEYTSEITKDSYNIRENIDMKYNKSIFTGTDNISYKFYEKDYYESDGIFCSFNCWLAHIHENKSNPLYKNSLYLLNKIYFDYFGEPPTNLKPAHSWKLLKSYGGHLSIQKFRETFNRVEYIDKGRILNIMKFKPAGNIFEEKAKL